MCERERERKLPGETTESCQGGKWNAAALYSIVSSKFVSDKKKKKKKLLRRYSLKKQKLKEKKKERK